jgi:hypothetical protein
MAERTTTDFNITGPIARVFGIDSDGDEHAVNYVKVGGGMVLTVTAKDRVAELRVYIAVIGKSVLRETNAGNGVQICTTWHRTTQHVTRTSQDFDARRGLRGELVGEAVPIKLADPEGARKRIARITQMVKQFLG